MADKSVKEMGKAELATELLELRKEQFNLRMQNSTCLLYTSDAADE